MRIVNDTFNCGVRTIVAQPEGVCCQAIELKLFGDVISEVNFYGGSAGCTDCVHGNCCFHWYPCLFPGCTEGCRKNQ